MIHEEFTKIFNHSTSGKTEEYISTAVRTDSELYDYMREVFKNRTENYFGLTVEGGKNYV